MDWKSRKPLRVWPGVAIAILQLLAMYVFPVVKPDARIYGMFAGFAGTFVVALWWLLLSRARWFERLGDIALMAGGLYLTKLLVDRSIATGGQGFLLYMLAVPFLGIAFVASAVATRRLADGPRRAAMAAVILLACGFWALIRTGGFTAGSFRSDLHWRWTKTSEERLLTKSGAEIGALPAAPPAATPIMQPEAKPQPATPPPPASAPKAPVKAPEAKGVISERLAQWPGFRGPHRDDVIPGVRIKTDWTASPPVAMWRRPVGPGWSSFAVAGNVFYTQEQRGPEEVVSCYKLATGEPVWAHRDEARFWESNGGPGPRATPTLSDGRVYTFGATGILNALDAATGSVVWSHNAAADTGMKAPQWGFAGSPLVIGDLVIAATSGQLAAYDRITGAKRWSGPAHGVSYSSPQLFTIGGVTQILLLSEAGLTSVSPADGKLLWEYAWPGYPITQPAVTSDGDVLISVSDSSGTRRLNATNQAGTWAVAEKWTSRGLKPYFNDFVVHNGHAYGFDGSILACIDLADGKRLWKGGRYGNGQLVLLADQDLLLVESEEGEIALVRATPDQFTEVAHAPAIEGKTWGHPVVAENVLLVRNGEQMAAFRLTAANQ